MHNEGSRGGWTESPCISVLFFKDYSALSRREKIVFTYADTFSSCHERHQRQTVLELFSETTIQTKIL